MKKQVLPEHFSFWIKGFISLPQYYSMGITMTQVFSKGVEHGNKRQIY
jgi:hypothetical protein